MLQSSMSGGTSPSAQSHPHQSRGSSGVAAATISNLAQESAPRLRLDGEALTETLAAARRLEGPDTRLGESLTAMHYYGHLPRIQRQSALSGMATIGAIGMMIGGLLMGGAAQHVLFFGSLIVMGITITVSRSARRRFDESKPSLGDRFGNEDLGLGYRELLVERAPLVARGFFQRALAADLSQFDRTRALFGLVQVAEKLREPQEVLNTVELIEGSITALEPRLRLQNLGVQGASLHCLHFLAKRMHDTRYERGSPERGEHPFVNPRSVRVLCNFIRSVGPPPLLTLMSLVDLQAELDRTVGAHCAPTRLALAEFRGLLSAFQLRHLDEQADLSEPPEG